MKFTLENPAELTSPIRERLPRGKIPPGANRERFLPSRKMHSKIQMRKEANNPMLRQTSFRARLWMAAVLLVLMVASVVMMPGVTVTRRPKAEQPPQVREVFSDVSMAIANGQAERVAKLIEAGLDVNASDGEQGRTPLMHAAWSGKTQIVKLLLSAGASVEALDQYGETPLHYAARSIRDEDAAQITGLLLAAKAPVNAADKAGETALHVAAGNDDPERLKQLLAAGARTNAIDHTGRTALMNAVEARDQTHSLVARVQLLIEHGADPDLRDKDGKTALEIARERLAFLSGSDFNERQDGSIEGFRKMYVEANPDERTAAKLDERLDDVQRASREFTREARTNLPVVIRLLEEITAK